MVDHRFMSQIPLNGNQTPPMSDLYKTRIKDSTDLYKTRIKDSTEVSPLEVISSMAGKVGKRIDEGILGNFARGYLSEQILTSVGKSGYAFNTKYIDNDAMHTNPGRKFYRDSTALGFLAGAIQDLATLYLASSYIGGNESTLSESCAVMTGLKAVTQIGAYVARQYKSEKARLLEAKRK